FVAISTRSMHLLPENQYHGEQIYLFDVDSRRIRRISVEPSGWESDSCSVEPALSADATVLAYRSTATNLVEGDLNARAALESWQAPEFRRLGDTLDEMAERVQLANQAFKASEARYKLLAENTADLVTHIDAGGKRTYASPASQALLGYAPHELIGGDPIDLGHPLDRPRLAAMLDALQAGAESPALQYRAQRKDGTYVWVEVTGRSLGGDLGVMLSLRDVSRRKSAEDLLEEANRNLFMLASTDGLTGLANRRSFDKALVRELARCARDGLPIALLLIDVDHFKSYNDSYGHQEGDECLKRLSHLLRGMARRPGDVAARYGGEEFAVILPNTSADGGQQFAENLRTSVEALNIPHCRSSYGIVTVSIGMACEIPIGGVDSAILQHADAALYAAKAKGRNRTETYSGSTPDIAALRYGG
ncbi:MAG: diguanylate cyclase, partial [Hyphomicrobium sp.]|nr:diguanylate cyclase [Hyphomicrobium sp.]